MKKLILVFLLLFATSTCFAGFGGARSSGSFSSGARSSFGGSRSSSFGGSRSSGSVYSAPRIAAPKSGTFGGNRSSMNGPATITKPQVEAPRTIYQSAPVVRETVIHHDSGGGFWNGLFMGSLLNSHPAPVVVVPGGQSIMEPAVVVHEGHSFFFYVFWSAILVFCMWLVWRMWKDSEA